MAKIPMHSPHAARIHQELHHVQALLQKIIRDLKEGNVDSLVKAVEEDRAKKEELTRTIER